MCKIKLSPETETPVTQHTPENPVFEAPFMADDSDVMTTKFVSMKMYLAVFYTN